MTDWLDQRLEHEVHVYMVSPQNPAAFPPALRAFPAPPT